MKHREVQPSSIILNFRIAKAYCKIPVTGCSKETVVWQLVGSEIWDFPSYKGRRECRNYRLFSLKLLYKGVYLRWAFNQSGY